MGDTRPIDMGDTDGPWSDRQIDSGNAIPRSISIAPNSSLVAE